VSDSNIVPSPFRPTAHAVGDIVEASADVFKRGFADNIRPDTRECCSALVSCTRTAVKFKSSSRNCFGSHTQPNNLRNILLKEEEKDKYKIK
jgi:hypothetical protein